MGNLKLKSWIFGVLLAGGCQLLVDADPHELGQGATKGACNDVECEAGSHCTLVDVRCIKAPCDPVAECVADDLDGAGDGDLGNTGGAGQACGKTTCDEGTACCNASCGICIKPGGVCSACDDDDEPSKPTCAATTCLDGTVCVEGASGAECKPKEEVDPPTICADKSCPVDTHCDDISGQAKCLPLPSCTGATCEEGTHCELQEVTCVRAPCPPQPTCVADADPCDEAGCRGECKVIWGTAVCLPKECKNPCLTARCWAGFHCEAKQVQCVTTPCCPGAQCVADSGGGACTSQAFCGKEN